MPQQEIEDFDFRPQYLPARVADKLQEMIVNHQFQVGERLPSERDLAVKLNVSRNVIREALKLLQERGLVSVQSGSGVYVTAFDVSAVSRSVGLYVKRLKVSIAQVYETRWLIEVQNARLAALRATPEDLKALADCLQRSKDHVKDPQIFTPLDIEFHILLAKASQNPVLPMLLETITDALQEQCQLTEGLPGAQANALMHHERIFKAVTACDADAASEAMSAHLKSGWEWLLRALENPPIEIGRIEFQE